ncbi:MAG: hypothetical protein AB8H47_05610 [Bacteroidia bacterium]
MFFFKNEDFFMYWPIFTDRFAERSDNEQSYPLIHTNVDNLEY